MNSFAQWSVYYSRRDLLLKQNLHSIMELPSIQKITVHASTKHALTQKKNILPLFVGILLCTAQRPTLLRAKKSIASFRLRKHQIVGCKSTLRGPSMYAFFEKLCTIVLPRMRDFQGIASVFQANACTFGFTQFLAFPELEESYELFDQCSGGQITITTSAPSVHHTRMLLSSYQFPLLRRP